MSRLQVGGLALVIGFEESDRNLGKVVQCFEYLGKVVFDDDSVWYDCWAVTGENLVDADMRESKFLYTRAKFLLPIGDNKTQEKMMKENESKNTEENV